jgi:CRISPR-associated protein Csx16
MMTLAHKHTLALRSTGQTWFVSRHRGSIEWVKTQVINIDQFCHHLDEDNGPVAGDTVIGTLPVHVIAKLNKMGVRFMHLEINLPLNSRGKELDRASIEQANAKMQEYIVWRVDRQG